MSKARDIEITPLGRIMLASPDGHPPDKPVTQVTVRQCHEAEVRVLEAVIQGLREENRTERAVSAIMARAVGIRPQKAAGGRKR